MSSEVFFNVLESFHPLSDEFKSAIKNELIPMSLPKNHVLLEAPKISTHAYFLTEGFAMSYSFHMGKRVTEDFRKSGEIVIAFESFFEQKPSNIFIRLMKRSDIFCISYPSVQKIFETFPEAQQIYRGVMNRHFAECLGRIRDIQRMTASERHKKLLDKFEHIEQVVSQDAIASYLGITAQSLARIKRKVR